MNGSPRHRPAPLDYNLYVHVGVPAAVDASVGSYSDSVTIGVNF